MAKGITHSPYAVRTFYHKTAGAGWSKALSSGGYNTLIIKACAGDIIMLTEEIARFIEGIPLTIVASTDTSRNTHLLSAAA